MTSETAFLVEHICEAYKIFQDCEKHLNGVQDSALLVRSYNIWATACDIGIKHCVSCINIRQVPWEVLKTEAKCCGFKHLPRDVTNVNALKKHV